jgi:hypothetical protein
VWKARWVEEVADPFGSDQPAEKRHPRVAEGEPITYEPPNLPGITVLVVDDDPDAPDVTGQDGYDLIRKVRALTEDARARVPAVALTAFARTEDRQRALLAGYQFHVAKPVEPSELLTVCASLVGRIS